MKQNLEGSGKQVVFNVFKEEDREIYQRQLDLRVTGIIKSVRLGKIKRKLQKCVDKLKRSVIIKT